MKKILVVDDEVGFTRLLQMNLEKTGNYQVIVVNDSTKALEAARTFKPDLALLDIVMPGMDGGDIVAKMKDDPDLCRVPVLMLTALVGRHEASADAVVQSGKLLMLSKPVRLSVLVQAIEEQLANAAAART
ncbi:MAG: response regulator [Verrucomicrobiales bacterium]|nr:response regulator [Verrucomicrobiales bacterium]